MKYPSPWKLIDFLSFGLFATVPTIIALIFSFSGPLVDSTGANVTVPGLLTIWGVVVLSWFVYFTLVYNRYLFNKRFSIKTKYNVMVNPNGYHITTRNVEEAIESMIEKFSHSPIDAKKHLEKDFIWVYFDPYLIGEKYGEPKKLWGFVKVGGNMAWVSYAKSVKEDVPDPKKPIEKTAFIHEISHIILHRAIGTKNEKTHHDFMREYKLL